MNVLDFVVFALAAWRLAYMLVKESGPFDMFGRLRRRAGISQVVMRDLDDNTTIGLSASNSFAEGLLCVWCVSVWTAALLVGLTLLPTVGCVFMWGARVLAISTGAIIVQESIAFVRGTE